MSSSDDICCTENPTLEEQNTIFSEAQSITKSLIQNNKSIADNETINIKVVFHICFQNPGTTSQINSDTQRTIDILNRDFNQNSSNFNNGLSLYESQIPSQPQLQSEKPYVKYRKNKKIIRLSRRKINQLRRQLGTRRFINYLRKINRINRNRLRYNNANRSVNARKRRINRDRSRSNRNIRKNNNALMSKYNSDKTLATTNRDRYINYKDRAGNFNVNFTCDYVNDTIISPLSDITQTKGVNLNSIIKINGSPIRTGDEYKLNIWVVNFTTGLLGYGQFPWAYPYHPETDGIVIDKNIFKQGQLFGSYNIGGVITHEVGHWLGLLHTFQQGQQDINDDGVIEDGVETGDFVIDTPNQSSPTSSINNNPYNNVKNWPKTSDYHMYMNYMDYVADICSFMFTEEQCNRMRILFNAYRSQFHTP